MRGLGRIACHIDFRRTSCYSAYLSDPVPCTGDLGDSNFSPSWNRPSFCLFYADCFMGTPSGMLWGSPGPIVRPSFFAATYSAIR